MKKALYRMMMSSLLFYRHFRSDLESIGFKVNPYDICVANRQVNGSQQTVTWHVDDVKVSHINPQVNEEFYKWCENKYGNPENGHVKVNRGKIHEYLAMTLDFTIQSKVMINMKKYITEMINDYPYRLDSNVNHPWNGQLFECDKDIKELTTTKSEVFHTFVMKGMFLAKRGRPDILTGISYLSTKIIKPFEEDLKKLRKVISYLKNTIDVVLTLEADDTQTLSWYVDSSFGVHKDLRSHTGAYLTLGKGCCL